MICPCCKKRVRKTHFACETTAAAGKAGRGESKRRGNSEFYKNLRAKRSVPERPSAKLIDRTQPTRSSTKD